MVSGIQRIELGECPRGVVAAFACTFCSFGHMLECHYPQTCDEAECSHYHQESAAEGYDFDEDYGYPHGEESAMS